MNGIFGSVSRVKNGISLPIEFTAAGAELGGDANFDKVKLLLDCEGLNNATELSDYSANTKTVQFFGGAKLSTAQSRFGTSSLYFDGVDSYLKISSEDFQFGKNKFAIEFAAYWLDGGHGDAYSALIQSGPPDVSGFFNLQNSDILNPAEFLLAEYYGGIYTALITKSALSNNVWHDVCLSYDTGIWYLLVDGVLIGSSVKHRSYGHEDIYIGGYSTGSRFKGYIDNIRLSTSESRHIAAYTPETSAFAKQAGAIAGSISKNITGVENLRVVAIDAATGETLGVTTTSSPEFIIKCKKTNPCVITISPRDSADYGVFSPISFNQLVTPS